MARPRVFISSTFYDLKYVRASLEIFIERLGYEAILSEKGKIAYDPDGPLDKSCYREAESSDIFVLILGGRYGSATSDEPITAKPEFYHRYESITKKEFESALQRDIPIYILVERAVMAEYNVFCKNRENKSIEYAQVESVNVFYLLDYIFSKRRNNPVEQFERHTEIEDWLREQWAGLFKEMITRRSEQRQMVTLSSKVEELASINKSLQRYLEVVVSNVSASPEEARELIENEQERQIEVKKMQEFKQHDWVIQLLERHSLQLDKIQEIFTKPHTVEELAELISEAVPCYKTNTLIDIWRKSDSAVAEINAARRILGLESLGFGKEK